MASNNDISSSTASFVRAPYTNAHEEALQSLCKQILKSRLFRGYYAERRYVENVEAYRDIVALQRGERDFEKLLLDLRKKLQLFYQLQTPELWIGITNGSAPVQTGALETCLWAELDDLAFGQYWFTVKNVRFREREIILKLKMVRAVEAEVEVASHKLMGTQTSSTNVTSNTSSDNTSQPAAVTQTTQAPQIDWQDFVEIIQNWGTSIKQTVYNFMSNDINKDNVLGFFKLFGLLVVSLLAGSVAAIKFLGIFTLRFMFEFSRLTHTLTPIVLKIIEVFNKIIGGFYILLAMIWKDAVVNRGQPKQPAIEYNRPLYRSIEYNTRLQQRISSPQANDEIERKCQ